MSQVVTMNGYKHLLVGVARSWNIFIPSSNLRACLGGLLTEGSLCGAGAEATELVFCGFFTTTEQAFVPSHLSRLSLGPVQKIVPGPTASRANGGTKVFCPGWRHQPGQKDPLLSRLVAPSGIKGPTLLSRLVTPTRTKG